MIRPPQRSVTRFFIPLIDVLILLFCTFLLMPLAQPADGQGTTGDLARLKEELDRFKQQGGEVPARLRQEIDQLRHAKIKTLEDRLAVRVLEINPRTGALLYRDPQPVVLADEAGAHALIEEDRRRRGVSRRELYYLILFPRDLDSPYPTRRQLERYEHWFAGVALGYSIPGAAPGVRPQGEQP